MDSYVAIKNNDAGLDWEFEISRCKLLYIKWINKIGRAHV